MSWQRSNDRLAVLPDGRIAHALKKRWRNGSTPVALDPLTFLEASARSCPDHTFEIVTGGEFRGSASVVVPPADRAELQTPIRR